MIILTLQLKKVRPREEVKDLAQSRIARKWQSQGSAFDGVTFKARLFPLFTTALLYILCTVPGSGL